VSSTIWEVIDDGTIGYGKTLAFNILSMLPFMAESYNLIFILASGFRLSSSSIAINTPPSHPIPLTIKKKKKPPPAHEQVFLIDF